MPGESIRRFEGAYDRQMSDALLYLSSQWQVALGIIGLLLLTTELGYRLARWRR